LVQGIGPKSELDKVGIPLQPENVNMDNSTRIPFFLPLCPRRRAMDTCTYTGQTERKGRSDLLVNSNENRDRKGFLERENEG
jgi:hypothetical protein